MKPTLHFYKLFFCFAFLFGLTAHSQIVNIPDQVFKDALLYYEYYNNVDIDTNNDGEIQVTEAEAITELIISGYRAYDEFFDPNTGMSCQYSIWEPYNPNCVWSYHVPGITSLTGIEAFVNLTSFTFSNNGGVSILDVSALTQLTYLDCSNNSDNAPYMTGIDVLNLPNSNTLTTLICNNNQLLELDVSNQIALTDIDASFNFITDLYLTNTPALEILNCTSNHGQLTSLDLSSSIALRTLECQYNDSITSLDTSNNTSLITLSCYNNEINSLTLPISSTLTHLNASSNNLITLDASVLTGLIEIDVDTNLLTNLVLPNTTTLTNLSCNNNQLTALDTSALTGLIGIDVNTNLLTNLVLPNTATLTNLNFYNNQLASIDITNNNFLTNLVCSNNQLTSIDVSQHSSLTALHCNNNNLSSLNMKNGNNTGITQFYATSNPMLTLICVDDIAYASTSFNNIDSHMIFADICSFIPANSNTITGTISYDFDTNGCDPLDVKSTNSKITTLGTSTASSTFSAGDGAYTLYSFDTSTDTSITPNFPSFFDVTPTTQNSTFSGSGNTDVVDYCITANATVNDVDIQVFSLEESRPGFDTSVRIQYTNRGSTTLSGDFDFTFENNKQTFLNASITPDSQTANSLSWDYIDLLPFESRYVDVFLNTNSPLDMTNPVVNGDTLSYATSITSTTGDVNPSDNTNTFVETTIGSYDPNDITIRQGPEITPAQALEFLNFRIRFQNTGTASAINIRVETLLDADLDWDTFEPISASHNYRTSLTDNNKVEFFFENIYLPDSTTDEPGSNGWVYFKIKPISGFAIGDLVEATAGIYFDYNPPVITNTATTEIPETLSIGSFNKDNMFSMFPNPTKNNITVAIQTEATFSILSINEQVIKQGQLQKGENTLNTTCLSNGLYFLQIKTNEGISTKKLIKD